MVFRVSCGQGERSARLSLRLSPRIDPADADSSFRHAGSVIRRLVSPATFNAIDIKIAYKCQLCYELAPNIILYFVIR